MNITRRVWSVALRWGLLMVVLGLSAERAAALEIKFSGLITEAAPGNYGVMVGDSFSGILYYNPKSPKGEAFGGAIVTLESSRPLPPIVFHPQNSALTIGDDFFFVVGNPYDFFGSLSLWLDEEGKLLGGEFFANSEPSRNNGSFRGIIAVPDAAATITLLGMGLAALALYRRSAGGTT